MLAFGAMVMTAGINCAVCDLPPNIPIGRRKRRKDCLQSGYRRAAWTSLPVSTHKILPPHQPPSVRKPLSKSRVFRDRFRPSINHVMPDAGLFAHDESKSHSSCTHSQFFDSELLHAHEKVQWCNEPPSEVTPETQGDDQLLKVFFADKAATQGYDPTE